MNGVHDLGGMHGFGPVIREHDEPVFHSDWEKRVFGMTLTAMGRRVCNVDEFRRAIEHMPPAGYLAATYYEKWLHALESLLVEKGVVTREEILSGHAAASAPAKATGSLDTAAAAAGSSRSTVPRSSCASTRATNPASRLATASSRAISIPSITRACRATRAANAASSATTTAFLFFPIRTRTARAASRSTSIPWRSRPGSCGAPTSNQRAPVYLDCWEDYLERDRAAAKPAVKSAPKPPASLTRAPAKPPVKTRTAKFATKARASKPTARPKARSRAAAKKGHKR